MIKTAIKLVKYVLSNDFHLMNLIINMTIYLFSLNLDHCASFHQYFILS